MARPTCWHCGKQLMYVKGAPVWAIVIVDGVEHRIHKDCKRYHYDNPEHDRSQAALDVRKALCTTGCKP